ncbi:putative toxin-antitoxin system toxin component, PIN family [Patescibacteria group bacterium]
MSWSIKPRVVLDANVFVSGIVWQGNPGRVLQGWLKDNFRLFISPSTLLEILTVLARFEIPPKIIQGFKPLIENQASKVIPKTKFKICRDPKDNQYLNLVYACQADYLVTGDKDLLILEEFEGTKILTPKQFLTRLKKRDRK